MHARLFDKCLIAEYVFLSFCCNKRHAHSFQFYYDNEIKSICFRRHVDYHRFGEWFRYKIPFIDLLLFFLEYPEWKVYDYNW